MAYKIDSDTCISCGACAGECPVSAISEGDSAYLIDADTCIECGACTFVCPAKRLLTQSCRQGKKVITTRKKAEAAKKAAAEAAKKAAEEQSKKEA